MDGVYGQRFRKSIPFIAWISFSLLVLGIIILSLLNLQHEMWLVLYFYIIIYVLILIITAFVKFKNANFLKTLEGKLFGFVSAILLLIFLCQVCWIVINIMAINKTSAGALAFSNAASYISFFMGLMRGIVYLMGIFLIVKAVKSYEIKLTFRRQLAFLILAAIFIFSFDMLFVHPLLSKIFASATATSFALNLIDTMPPFMNIILLLVSFWIFMILIKNKEARPTLRVVTGIFFASFIDLIFVALLNTNYYNENLSFITATGFAILFVILAYTAAQYHLKKKIDLSKIIHDRFNLIILNYIKSNPNCIKKDITRQFNITRVTTDERLNRLSGTGLINIKKSGRTRPISLSELGIIYLNSIKQ
ncbi:MAG: hypothetical protein V1859_11360 [archaeon]